MRVFGRLAYFRNTDTKGDKFEWRGKPGVFLGYPPGTKGYKIYDTSLKKIITSRDVKFVENKFPYKNSDPINKQENEELFSLPPWYYKENEETIQGTLHEVTGLDCNTIKENGLNAQNPIEEIFNQKTSGSLNETVTDHEAKLQSDEDQSQPDESHPQLDHINENDMGRGLHRQKRKKNSTDPIR
ncbi:hypothetical protein E3N88_31625 [Mikania micrantha]|uniref:Retroviral polymerase SH3-like domain-containing protein n=1 Tax=Mikania micrantha TaxID=192012 RepID=A0A5N6M6R1_9ASTR|nr:hypothetical protein E3N88_31625 [Mikania micrantha]